jgi:hypothetical protein
MKPRGVSLVLFVLLVGLTFTSCGESEADRRAREAEEEQARLEEQERLIIEMYRYCISNVQSSFNTINKRDDYTLSQYAAAFRGIDLEGCPSDFKKAFENHIDAWQQAHKIMTAYEVNDSNENFGRAFMESLLSGKIAPLIDTYQSDIELKKLLKQAFENIEATYDVMVSVSQRYGIG